MLNQILNQMKKLLFSIFVIFLSNYIQAQWEPEVRLTNNSSPSLTSINNAWSIASNGDTIHVVWWDSRDGNTEIYYKRSTDGGENWGADTRLTNNTALSIDVCIAVNGSNVHVVWEDNRDGENEIYYKRSINSGNTWGNDVRLTFANNSAFLPSIAVSGSNVHVTWNDARDSDNGEIYYKNSGDNGSTWGPDTRLSYNAEYSGIPSIAASGQKVYVAWEDYRNGKGDIYFIRSSNNGVNWGAETNLTENENDSWDPSIAAHGSVVHCTYQVDLDGVNYEIYYLRSTDAGVSWEDPVRLTNNSAKSEYPSIAANAADVQIVWQDMRNGQSEIYTRNSTDEGENWIGFDSRLTNSNGASENATVNITNSATHVVWQDKRDGNYEIYYKRNPSPLPDSNYNQRLFYLCKTWGYLKYFSQYKCDIKWDTLLNTTINEVLAATSNAGFNNAMMNMFNKVGNNSFVQNPGMLPDTNINFDNSWIDDPIFSQPVRDFLDTFSIHIYPDESECMAKFGTSSFIDFSGDPLSLPVDFYDEAYRLTYMFYYWNVINYFFPYKNLMDQDWDSTLYQFIPKFRQVATIPEFHIAFLQLVTKINDTHGYTASTVLNSFFWGGTYMPKIYFTRVDTNCVVTKVDGIEGISPGDILTGLKGIPIREIEDSLLAYIPASTPAAYYRELYYKMLWGQANSNLSLNLLDEYNNPYTVDISRNITYSSWYGWAFDPGLASSWFLTSCGYGYVNMGMLMPEEVTEMYDGLKDAPAIIFDIRNYPNGTLWDIGPLLFPNPITSAILYDPALAWMPAPYFYYYFPGWYYIDDDSNNLGDWSNPDAYQGNVYILVNEETQSQAEYTCQYLSYHHNATVFGTQTAGADGNVSSMSLPGGITTYFTSLGWYYADGYQQQRNGVKIDSIVSPTIAGIRLGKDEILEAALDCLTKVEENQLPNNNVLVFPNPVSDQKINIELTLETNANITVLLYNLTGEIILQQSKNGIQGDNILNLKLPNIAAGLYFLQVKYENQLLNTKVIVK